MKNQVAARIKRSSRPTPCEITPAQEKKWTETRAALLSQCPAFSHILYSMMNPGGKSSSLAYWTKEVPIAATDGVQLLLNPDTFFEYTLKERIFIVAHEIMHNIFNHCGMLALFVRQKFIAYSDGKKLPVSPELLNIALDLVINDILIESKVGAFNPEWLHDTSIGTAKDSAIDVYRKLFDQLPPECKKQCQQPGQGSGQDDGQGDGDGDDPSQAPGVPKGKRFDEHLPPGTSQDKTEAEAQGERSDIEWKTAVAAAAASARVQGKLPAGLERILGEVLEPVIDWTDKIKSFFARKVGGGSYNWRRADRRLITRTPEAIYAPSRSGHGCGTVCVGVDTSGSINGPILDRFFAEVHGILEDLKPERLVLLWCDAKVHRVDEVEDVGDMLVVRALGAPGGGGTSFVPVFDEIDKLGITPDALVYLTDGMGTFPGQAPDYPVMWGNIYPHSTYPFGDVVDVPV